MRTSLLARRAFRGGERFPRESAQQLLDAKLDALRSAGPSLVTAFAEFFDSLGGDINTACGNNTWYWTASCLKEDFEKTIAVYADVVKNPAFPEDELSFMKQGVIAAIESQDADWTAQAIRYFKQQHFGQSNSPYQFVTIGKKENVERFAPEQLKQWYQDKILKAPRVLAIYGDVDVHQAKELALATQFNQTVESATQDDFIVKVYRDTAVVWFTLRVVGIKQGQKAELTLRYTDVWVMRDGRWQCVSTHSTRVAAK